MGVGSGAQGGLSDGALAGIIAGSVGGVLMIGVVAYLIYQGTLNQNTFYAWVSLQVL